MTPKVGETIEVEHEGEWQEATVTDLTPNRVMGRITDPRVQRPTSFSSTLDSYRSNWRRSQRPKSEG